jgi:hypothetical protein
VLFFDCLLTPSDYAALALALFGAAHVAYAIIKFNRSS